MSERLIPIPIVNESSEQRWAAWQARGDMHDRETRRRLFLLMSMVLFSGALLSGLWWF